MLGKIEGWRKVEDPGENIAAFICAGVILSVGGVLPRSSGAFGMMKLGKFGIWIASLAVIVGSGVAGAADFTARQVTETLFHRDASAAPADFHGKDLSFLDLAGLDFHDAELSGVNFYGADLSNASLRGARLAGARLDASKLTRTDLSDADLHGATLLSIMVFSTIEPNSLDAPNFANANLRGAHIAARLDGANFRHADLSSARLGQLIATWGSYRPRAVFNGADFSDANLSGADLSKAVLQFTHFVKANLTRAILADCDLTKADFSGANFSGADLTGADFDGAILSGATGLETAMGISTAKNLDRAVR